MWNNRAWAKYQLGLHDSGLVDVEKSLELNPNSGPSVDTYAHILEALGRKDEAIVQYRRAVAFNPEMKGSAAALLRLEPPR